MPFLPILKVVNSSDHGITFTRGFDAPRRFVWDCHTKPDLVRRWLLGPEGWTMPVCRIDLRVGGEFRYEWRKDDGRTMGMGGVFRELDQPKKIVHTEIFDEDWTGGETVATTLFSENDGRTMMTMTVLYSSTEARDAALKTGMTRGMEAGYARLDEILASMKF
jgi:uncharacterized protein YndB with AHSA1/START domain